MSQYGGSKCEAGKIFTLLSEEDVLKLEQARETGISWPMIAQALRSAGHQNATHGSLSRHHRKACACERNAAAPVEGLSFTPLDKTEDDK